MKIKKILKEETDEKIVETAASETLHAGSKSASNPDSIEHKTAILSKMIGAAHAMSSDELTKWWDQTIARAKEIGHGPGVGNNAASNRATLDMKPSHASHVKEAVKADLDKILSEQEGLSEGFKVKATTLFEAAVDIRVNLEVARIEEELAAKNEVEFEKAVSEVADGIQEYLDYAAQEWMKDNEVAIESSLRNELAQDLLDGLKAVFVENNVVIPEEQVEVVDTMAERIDDLEARLADALSEQTALRDRLEDAEKKEIVASVCEGLALTEAEKLKELADNIDYETVEEFKTKIGAIKESNFVKEPKKSVITEGLEETDNEQPTEKKTFSSPQMKSYAQAISRNLRR